MSDNKDIYDLIRSQVNKAKNLFTQKDIIENEIKEIFNNIGELMNDNIVFTFENETDRYGDPVTTVYAKNPNMSHKYTVITYDFDNKSIFPIKISDSRDIPWLCNDLDEVKKAMSSFIEDDNFMIRLVAISKEKNNQNYELDDDIPF